MNYFIETRMKSLPLNKFNIIKNTLNMKMEEFHPERTKSTMFKFMLKSIKIDFKHMAKRGKLINILNSVEILDEFNCVDPTGKIINTINYQGVEKGVGTWKFYPKALNPDGRSFNLDSPNLYKFEYENGQVK